MPGASPIPSQRVQVGRYISDFKIGSDAAGGDKPKYYSSINYDGLSSNAKVIADKYFDSQKKKDDDTFGVHVIYSTRNPDGTYTNKLSDGSTVVVREAPTGKYTAAGAQIFDAAEVGDRTGLKTVTPVTPDNSVAGIRTTNPGMSIADARAESLRRKT